MVVSETLKIPFLRIYYTDSGCIKSIAEPKIKIKNLKLYIKRMGEIVYVYFLRVVNISEYPNGEGGNKSDEILFVIVKVQDDEL